MPKGNIMASNGKSLAKLEARLLESTRREVIAYIRETLPLQQAQAAVEGFLYWDSLLPLAILPQPIVDKPALQQVSACKVQPTEKLDHLLA
jgi:hypothetical protein